MLNGLKSLIDDNQVPVLVELQGLVSFDLAKVIGEASPSETVFTPPYLQTVCEVICTLNLLLTVSSLSDHFGKFFHPELGERVPENSISK